MKKIKILLILIIVVLFSCSKDIENDPVNSSKNLMYFLINCVNGTLAFFRNSLLLSRESNEAPQKSILVSYEEVSLSLMI